MSDSPHRTRGRLVVEESPIAQRNSKPHADQLQLLQRFKLIGDAVIVGSRQDQPLGPFSLGNRDRDCCSPPEKIAASS